MALTGVGFVVNLDAACYYGKIRIRKTSVLLHFLQGSFKARLFWSISANQAAGIEQFSHYEKRKHVDVL